MIALVEVIWNLISVRLWLTIAFIVVITHLLQAILFGVGLIIGDVGEFGDEMVSAIYNVINKVANEASKVEHGAKDFFTGHFNRLSHEGDYAKRIHLTVPPVLLQLAKLKKDIEHGGKSGIQRSFVEMMQLISHVKVCPALTYFQTISLSRWVINRLVDALIPGLCADGVSQNVLLIEFLFDGLPRLLGWIGTTGVILWLIFIEGWPLIRFGLMVIFQVILFVWMKFRRQTSWLGHFLVR